MNSTISNVWDIFFQLSRNGTMPKTAATQIPKFDKPYFKRFVHRPGSISKQDNEEQNDAGAGRFYYILSNTSPKCFENGASTTETNTTASHMHVECHYIETLQADEKHSKPTQKLRIVQRPFRFDRLIIAKDHPLHNPIYQPPSVYK